MVGQINMCYEPYMLFVIDARYEWCPMWEMVVVSYAHFERSDDAQVMPIESNAHCEWCLLWAMPDVIEGVYEVPRFLTKWGEE